MQHERAENFDFLRHARRPHDPAGLWGDMSAEKSKAASRWRSTTAAQRMLGIFGFMAASKASRAPCPRVLHLLRGPPHASFEGNFDLFA